LTSSEVAGCAKKEPKKHTVLALVERNGESRSFHVVKAKTLREKIVKAVIRWMSV
jgi:hypothetical protein